MNDAMIWNTERGKVTLFLPRDVDAVEIDEVEKVITMQLKTWRRIMEERIARWPFPSPSERNGG